MPSSTIPANGRLPVVASRNELARLLNVQNRRVYRATECGAITPDFLDTNGTPFFKLENLAEVRLVLEKQNSTVSA